MSPQPAQPPPPLTEPPPPTARRATLLGRLRSSVRLHTAMYLLLLPTFIGMVLLNYYPKFSVIKYSFFLWDGSTIEEFRGLKNFRDAINDPLFWQTFRVVGILLVANLFKMWPSILAAITLHRLRNQRWQYAYRVLFVVPMVIPALVWLLVWKSFYDPNVGILNVLLTESGLMRALQWLDTAMPALARMLSPLRDAVAGGVFGGVWGLAAAGAVALTAMTGLRGFRRLWVWWAILLPVSVALMGPARAAVIVPLLVAVGAYLGSRGAAGRAAVAWLGGALTILAVFFIFSTMVWAAPTDAFATGAPAWLGHSKLIIPAAIFWGFPWVGTIGVLIYLAGLQNISQDVYEAADIDGAGTLTKLFHIELPLILTQVRINLIFMTIGTLMDYGFFLILLGPEGGPGNVGMVPGLYMYNEAFIEGRFGYACALGMVMFMLVLVLTLIYQKYIKVEK